MDQVFRIVQDHGIERRSALLFQGGHAQVNRVQAVGFRGGTGARTLRHMHIRKLARELRCLPDCFFVVRIYAQEESKIPVANGGKIVPHHVSDYLRFAPAWDKDGDVLLDSTASLDVAKTFRFAAKRFQTNNQRDEIVDSA